MRYLTDSGRIIILEGPAAALLAIGFVARLVALFFLHAFDRSKCV